MSDSTARQGSLQRLLNGRTEYRLPSVTRLIPKPQHPHDESIAISVPQVGADPGTNAYYGEHGWPAEIRTRADKEREYDSGKSPEG